MNALVFLMAISGAGSQQPVQNDVARWIDRIAQSGRVIEIGEVRERLDDPRKQIAPGAPPLLSFRYFLGVDRHRFGKLDVMLDDAGH